MEVKTILLSSVPTALSVPKIFKTLLPPFLALITVPGSIVKVVLDATVTSPSNIYTPSLDDQVVSEERVPLTAIVSTSDPTSSPPTSSVCPGVEVAATHSEPEY